MNSGELLITLSSCVAFMALVGWISYRKTRGEAETKEGYFLAGHGLSAGFIAGSLLLTNLSAEQMIGLNGAAYGSNLSSMAWEVTAAFSAIAMAVFFLPRYLAGAFTTLPEFLASRFDEGVRRMSAVLFILGYGFVTIPSVLYSGSLAVIRLFRVEQLTGLAAFPALVLTVVLIGLVGSVYAVFGGLRAVAVSDTLNGVGLLIVGLLVPVLGLVTLGEGSFLQGVRTLASQQPQKLNAVGGQDDPTPFGTLFTGMILANLFYWCTNQYVIQRALGGASLAEAQKGVMLAGFFKVGVPFLMMIPGVIAFHLYGPGLATIDEAYPRLVDDVMPAALGGFFLAVLLGAVFSSFNSLLNSAATLFTLDLWAPLKKTSPTEQELIRMARIVGVAIALFSFVAAPLLSFAEAGLWQIIRVFTGFYNIPIIAIVLVGILTKNVPPLGAKLVIGFHLLAYGLWRFSFLPLPELHFIHQYAVLFIIEVAIMLAVGRWRPAGRRVAPAPVASIDMAPWRSLLPVSVGLASCVVGLYLLFSPLGIADGRLGEGFWLGVFALSGINLAVWVRHVPVLRSGSKT